MDHHIDLFEKALEQLKAQGMSPVAIAVPASECGISKPDWLVALVYGPNEGESQLVYVDANGVSCPSSGDSIMWQWGDFLVAAVVGDVSAFDTAQRH